MTQNKVGKRLEALLFERDRSNLKTAIACGEIFLEFEEKKRYSLAADHGITAQTAKKYILCFECSQKFFGEWSEEIAIISDSKLDLNQIIQYFTQETFLMWAASKEVDINVWVKVVEWLVQNKKRLTKPVYRQIESSTKALESSLIPKEIKKKVEEGSLPQSIVAPLVKAIEELPEQEQPLVFADNDDFSADNLELITQDIKDIVKINENLAATLTLRDTDLNANALKEQLKRVEAVSLGASFISAMAKVEKLARKLKQAWEKLGCLGERLFVETGVSTPEIRKLLGYADTLTQNVCRIPSVSEDESFSITFNTEPIEQKTSSGVLETPGQEQPLNLINDKLLSIEFLPEEIDYAQGRYLLMMTLPWEDSYAKEFIDLYDKHEECAVIDKNGNEIGSILLVQKPSKNKIALKDLAYEGKYARMSDSENIISFLPGSPPETGLWAINFIFTPSNYILRESCLLLTSEMSFAQADDIGEDIEDINNQLKSIFEEFSEYSVKSYCVFSPDGNWANYEWDLWEYDFEKNRPKTFAGKIYFDENCLMVDDFVTHAEIGDKIEAILNY